MISEEVKTKFRTVLRLREQRDLTKVAAENASRDYREAEAELWEEMRDGGIEGAFKVPLGGDDGTVGFTAVETPHGRILDEFAAIDWLKKHGYIDSHTEPKITKARLSEIIRERLEAGEKLPDGTDWTPTRYIRITVPKG